MDRVSVGTMSYGPLEVYCWNAQNEKLVIGNYVSIASGVKFLLGGNHYYDTLFTYPFKVKVLKEPQEAWSKGPIIVEDDVWIGMDAMILSGVRIGQGAVVAARSVVSTDVPPYAIVAGNPARVVKWRFPPSIIERLTRLDCSSITLDWIKKNIDLLYTPVDEHVLEQLNLC